MGCSNSPIRCTAPIVSGMEWAPCMIEMPPARIGRQSASRDSSCWALNPDKESVCAAIRSEEHTSELQSRLHLVCRLLLEKKKEPVRTRNELVILHVHSDFFFASMR